MKERKTARARLRHLAHGLYEGVVSRLPGSVAASLDLRRPSLWASFGGPLNGQVGRQRLVREILSAIAFDVVVETGTYRGTTTEFLHHVAGLPVYTVENSSRFHVFARRRLTHSTVKAVHADVVDFLGSISHEHRDQTTLFYLDAHWSDHLPLREELEIISGSWRSAVVIIDDFRVPDDDGYGYDDYGDTGVIDESAVRLPGLDGWVLFYPSFPSAQETGARRGCAVVVSPSLADKVSALEGLRGGIQL